MSPQIQPSHLTDGVPEQVKPFSETPLDDALIQRFLATTPLGLIDPESFSQGVSLEFILRRDARMRHFEPGDLIVAKGDYGNSAFFIISGEVHVVLDDQVLSSSRGERPQGGWRLAISQLFQGCRMRERKAVKRRYSALTEASLRGPQVVPNYAQLIAGSHCVQLRAGDVVGEIAVLTRAARTASIVAGTKCELLEVRWQGLRDLRRYSDSFRAYIDHTYRQRTLHNILASIPLFKGLTREELEQIAAQSNIENYGRFDWYTSFNLSTEEGKHTSMNEAPIVNEGRYADGLLLITSGFARMTQRVHHGHATTGFLRSGDLFGGGALLEQWKKRREVESRGKMLEEEPEGINPGWSHSLHTIGYVDLLRIPTRLVETFIFDREGSDLSRLERPRQEQKLTQGVIEFFAEHRYINGSAAMVIDLQRCVRCDDCVRACSAAHEGNPRFLRVGREHGRYQVTRACMHCHDPVCMIGCPSGAIRRASNGHILIEDETCIGCANCAVSCPFDAINMALIDPGNGADQPPQLRATKCDLCADQLVTPQCEQACPHGALKRLDLADLESSARWLK